MANVGGMASQPSPQEEPSSRPGVLTLVIASASSVVAAIVVSRIWGPGTLIGAAATPVIVTFVGELLKKPAAKITVVRVSPSGTEVHERAAPPEPVGGQMAERSVHRSRRKPLLIALGTGLVAFVIGAAVLTSSELVFGDASVASGDKRTTVFGGDAPKRTPDAERAVPPTATGPTTSTETQTETVPAPGEPTVTATPQTAAPSEATPPSDPSTPSAAPVAPESGPTEP